MATLREGELYPELRHARFTQCQIFINEVQPLRHYQNAEDGDVNMTVKTVTGVRLEMPQADFDRMMNIYQTHYNAASHNPAVRDAWEKYQMLIALTLRDINGTP